MSMFEGLNVDPIAFGGGGIHCSTQQQPVGVVNPPSTTAPWHEMKPLSAQLVADASVSYTCHAGFAAAMWLSLW